MPLVFTLSTHKLLGTVYPSILRVSIYQVRGRSTRVFGDLIHRNQYLSSPLICALFKVVHHVHILYIMYISTLIIVEVNFSVKYLHGTTTNLLQYLLNMNLITYSGTTTTSHDIALLLNSPKHGTCTCLASLMHTR